MYNFEKNECESYNAKIACYRVCHTSKSAKQSPGGGQASPLCGQLASSHCGPLGIEYCSGISNSLPGGTETGSDSSPLSVSSRSASPTAGRVGLTGKQRGYHSSGAHNTSGRFLLHRILGSKEGGSVETGHQPQSPQLVGSTTTFQDGGYSHLKRAASQERLASQVGPEGCLLHCPDPSGSPEVPSVRSGTGSLPVHLPSVRSILCSLGVHEGSSPCGSLPPDSGSPNDCLHRRYVDHGRVPGCGTGPRDRHGCIIRRTRLHSKHGQVRVKPYSTVGVSRLAGELCRSSPSSTRGEDQANPRRGLTAASSRDMHCSQVSTVHRQVDCYITSSISCPAFLPPPTERPTADPVSERAGLQFFSPAFSGSSRGDTVVATTSLPMERQIFDSASRADGYLLGCFLSRMGSSMREDPHRRTVVSVGTRVAHQLFGAEGGNSGLTVLSQGSDEDIGITAAGQPDCSIVHQPLGGTVSPQLTDLAKNLWLWSLCRDLVLTAQHIPGVDNQIADSESRELKDRLDWKLSPAVFRTINAIWGPLEVDLFASRLSYQLTRFFSWRPDPLAEATNAFQQDWAPVKGYANPPWCLIGKVLNQVRTQQVQVILVAPIWRGQPWYPVLLEMLWDYPRLLPQLPDLFQMTSSTVALDF